MLETNARPLFAAGERAQTTTEQQASYSSSCYLNDRGQRCAELLSDNDGGLWLVSNRDERKHLLRNRDAWAFDERFLTDARERGALGTEVRTSSLTYWARWSDWDSSGFRVPDFGYGLQRALGRQFWSKAPAGLSLSIGGDAV
jgi:hypothetical protein